MNKDQPAPGGGFERWTVALNLAPDGTPVNVTGTVLQSDGAAIFLSCQFRDRENLDLGNPASAVALRCRTAPPCSDTAESCARVDWLTAPGQDVSVPAGFFLPAAQSGGGFLPPTPSDSQRGATLTEDARSFVVSKDLGGERWSVVLNRAPADGSGPPPFTSLTGNVFRTDGRAPDFVFCDAADLDEADLLRGGGTVRASCQLSSSCEGSPEECAGRWSDVGAVDIPVSFLLPAEGLREGRGGGIRIRDCVVQSPCQANTPDGDARALSRIAQEACDVGSPCTTTFDQCGQLPGVLIATDDGCLCEASLAGTACLLCSPAGAECRVTSAGEVVGVGTCQPETSSGRLECASPEERDVRGCGGVSDLSCPETSCCGDDRSDGCDPLAGGLACPGLCLLRSTDAALCAEREERRLCNGIRRDPGEACDGEDVGDAICADLGFAGGVLRCQTPCTLDTSGCFGAVGSCGDGVRGPAEECDDGNATNADACKNDCRRNICGDGVPGGPGESCDDGNTSNADACTTGCAPGSCGDGFVQPPEECDDGNSVHDDECSNTCMLPRCGDGIVQPPEVCDDGSGVSADDCTLGCLRPPFCGDGVVQAPEACDDGNRVETDGCTNDCRVPERCGDGIVQAPEACDDGNEVDDDLCSNQCRSAFCGDGVRQGAELCDDGNFSDADACRSNCLPNLCGDGVPGGPDEACDDGNGIDADACRNDCQVNTCGDGVAGGAGEQCDDGNDVEEDLCRNGCLLNVCGDDVAGGAGEQCDDGNDDETDGCSSTCQLTGTVAANLTWNANADLDLYLRLPDGSLIYYANTPVQGGGLDADDRCSTLVNNDGDETITFPANAPVGTYAILVDYFALCDSGADPVIAFSYTATVNGGVVVSGSGSVSVPTLGSNPIEVATFEVP